MLPLVGSTITPPGFSRPARSAASIIGSAIRSFTEPPGFMCSSLATSRGRTSVASRSRATSGVRPTAAVMSGRMPPGRSASARLRLRAGRVGDGGRLLGGRIIGEPQPRRWRYHSHPAASTTPIIPIHIAVGTPRMVQLLTRYVSSRVRTLPYHMMYISTASPAKRRGAYRRMTKQDQRMPMRFSTIS